MNRAELRRLAIRLARHTSEEGGICYVRCRDCEEWTEELRADTAVKHTKDCPIAELEAEEAASVKLSIGGVEFETVPVPAWKLNSIHDHGDDWSAELKGEWRPISMELKDGTSAVGYVRMVPKRNHEQP